MNAKEKDDLLSQYNGGYWKVSRKLVAKVGFAEAAFFDVLVQYEFMMIRNSYIKDGESFYYESEKCELATGLSYKVQKRMYDVLEKAGLISTKVMGIPPRKQVTIHYDKLKEFLNG